ncbi:MAG: hypothetical protein JWM76_832 [Pseudonocardiales bacterium]|nr:hypothetical protein [Pseudonocardiales bacterium]
MTCGIHVMIAALPLGRGDSVLWVQSGVGDRRRRGAGRINITGDE